MNSIEIPEEDLVARRAGWFLSHWIALLAACVLAMLYVAVGATLLYLDLGGFDYFAVFFCAVGWVLMLSWFISHWHVSWMPVWTFAFGVLMLFLTETQIVLATALLHRWPPPRPMCSIEFGIQHEFSILPSWESPHSVAYGSSWQAWVDEKDNAIVLTQEMPMRIDAEAMHFPSMSGEQAVGRTSSALVVLGRDGSAATFPLAPEQARAFRRQMLPRPLDDLMEAGRALLAARDRPRFDRLVQP